MGLALHLGTESDRDLGHDLALRVGHHASIPEGSAEQMTTTRPELAVEHDGSSSIWTSRLDFVITPLHSQQQPADVAAARKIWDAASRDRQTAWATAFDTALTNADDDLTRVPAGAAAHLQGNTWGMMNETGSYPGQAWLWLYSFLVPDSPVQLR
jgi:hypothetical protein